MLIVETIGRIRREHFVKGKTIKEIVRDLGISRNTVRKALRSEETSFVYGRDTQPLPKLGPWSKKLDDGPLRVRSIACIARFATGILLSSGFVAGHLIPRRIRNPR